MNDVNPMLPTVTVAVSAFNEAQNIAAWLTSVLSQREEGFVLERIIVVSDGSTDATADIARAVTSGKVEVWKHHERVGKSSRLNEVYSSLTSDILVQSDADVILAHPYVIRDLIQPLLTDSSVGMCGGNSKPLPARTFTERAAHCTFEALSPFRIEVGGGHNVFSAEGSLLAYRREMIQRVSIPHDMFADDHYVYFSCITAGWAYRHVPSAVVYFRLPQTLRDHVMQSTRILAFPLHMSRYFPKELVQREYSVSRRLKLKKMLQQFVRHPVLCGYIFLINRYCQLRAFFLESKLTALWQTVPTTKRLDS